MAVYMIQAGQSGAVKIGRAADPLARLRQIQTSIPAKLRFLRVLEGDRDEERALHQRFVGHRLVGEWFTFDAAMLGDLGLPELPLPGATQLWTGSAADIIRALGGATFLATKIAAKRSAISNWPRDGIPGKFWPALARLAAESSDPVARGITIEVLEAHTVEGREVAA